MRNTGIEYSSAERTPVVLKEMKELLPPLSEEQFSALQADILTNGCYAPVIVDEEMHIIDGHNRQNICQEHNISYRMLVFSFEDLLEAKQWALDTQKGRRNLTLWDLGQIALKLKPDLEARGRLNQSAGGQLYSPKEGFQNSENLPNVRVNTTKEMADSVGISHDTMNRIIKIDEQAPPVVKEALDNKELSINQGYNITKQIQHLPEEEQDEAARAAIEKAQKHIKQVDAELDRKGKIATTFSKGFEKAVQIDPSPENVRIWVETARMTPLEIDNMAKEAEELSANFALIAQIIRNDILPEDWRCEDEYNPTGSY